jgi:integrase
MGKSYRTEARARILSDDELRAIWRACDDGHPTFGAMVKVLLLTSARREKVSTMKWSDIDDRGVWNIPRVKGEKANAGSLPLPPLALDIIRSRPRIDGNPFVFASTHAHLRSFSKLKAELDAKSGVRGWRLHDLRRTARSLLSRAGVRPDISERVLGHTLRGVEKIYDRYDFQTERGDALAALAKLVETIINPPATTNVVTLKAS